MACDIEKIEDNEKENPNIVIQLNTLGLDELVSLTLKLEEVCILNNNKNVFILLHYFNYYT